MLNGHGDDLHLIEGEITHNFSSNVYYKGCPEALLDDISRNINLIQSYPSPTASELNELAAKKFQLNNEQFLFEGICKGEITKTKQGHQGFGYDPIFKAEGYNQTFAEISLEEKNRIGHRGKAVQLLIEFLESYKNSS